MIFRSLTLAALVTAALSTLTGSPVFGQTTLPSPPQEADSSTEQRQNNEQAQEYELVHVNAGSGRDASGDGSQLRPFQTISHALDGAEPNTVILLSPGEYSAASGEVFPLRLRPGVTVQGAVGTNLGSTVIRGNGTLVAANGTYMQVTVVGVDGAGLANVMVTNPSPSGYGLVIEAGRPILRFNGFVGSGYAGAYVGGTAAPLFEQNLFAENGSVGLLLADQSRAEVVANTFQNTGTGIQVTPEAEPRIHQNRIVSNRQGIVMAANAQPQLQDNEIARNRQNGLIEFTAATKTEAGARARGTTTAPQPLASPQSLSSALPMATVAVRRYLAAPPALQAPPQSEAETSLSLPSPPATPGPSNAVESGNGTTETNAPAEDAEGSMLPAPSFAITEEPDFPAEPNAAVPDAAVPDAAVPDVAVPDVEIPAAAIPDASESSSTESIAIDSPSTDLTEVPQSATAEFPPLEDIPQASEVVADPVPVEDSRATEAQQHRDLDLPLSTPLAIALDSSPSGDLLRVPEGNIPTGRGTSQIPVLAAAEPSNPPNFAAHEPPPPPSRASMLGLVYRVVVAAADSSSQDRIRAIVPDAFRVEVDGQMMMQVGAYSTEAEAMDMLAELQQQGIEAEMLHRP